MIPEERQWEINLVQQRYAAYNLSYEQAEQVFRYEQDKSAHSEEHFFSTWEELDFELATFKELLTGEALALFLSHHQAQVEEIERQMREEDNSERQFMQLEYAGEILKYYKEVFVPSLWKNEDISTFRAYMFTDRAKVTYLKAEYKRYLEASKKGILVSAYRHNKTLRPNQLKQLLLIHSRAYIWPAYETFYQKTDVPTKSLADFLSKKLARRTAHLDEFIKHSIAESNLVFKELCKQYFGDPRGWHVVSATLPEEEEIGNFRMNLLLLDPPAIPFTDPLPEQ